MAAHAEGTRLPGGELRRQPALQRVRSEVLLDNEIRRATGHQAGQPGHQQVMQGGLADADRRVGPDGVEAQVGRHVVGGRGMEVRDPHGPGVVPCQGQGALVHVHRPDAGLGAEHAQAQGDRTPPRADVQEIAGRGRSGRLVQQDGGADVDPVRAEDARCRRDDDLPARQVHPKLSAFGGAGRLGREVVVGLSAHQRPRYRRWWHRRTGACRIPGPSQVVFLTRRPGGCRSGTGPASLSGWRWTLTR